MRSNLNLTQCIFSLASGSLPSAVAIVKLSGANAFKIAEKIFSSSENFERKRHLWHGELRNVEGRKIDEIVALSFVAPHSHTGEDLIEFQCHGSKAIVDDLQETLLQLGARPAEGGEFSYRALVNGRMSPNELDDLADVFLAKDILSVQKIYSRKENTIQKQIDSFRGFLIELQAVLDTAIDFSEEYSSVLASAKIPLKKVIHECSMIIQRYALLKQGQNVPRLVLAGKPNAGKSSLFNAILCSSRAIVHSEPGTTRDVIEEDIQIGKQTWKLVDTAGFRSEVSGPEQKGIELGESYLSQSNFWLLVVDGTTSLSSEEEELLSRFGQIPHRIVWNKSDLADYTGNEKALRVSAETGDGVRELLQELEDKLSAKPLDLEFIPTSKETTQLKLVYDELLKLEKGLSDGLSPEYLSEMNRLSLLKLDNVIGEVSVEQVLDRVFSEFCIGK